MGKTQQNLVYIVTGAAGGLGSELVRGLLNRGAWVFALTHKRSLSFKHERLIKLSLDLLELDNLKGQLDSAFVDIQHPLGGVIHAAGITHGSPIAKTTLEEWDNQFNVNFFSAKIITEWGIQKMCEKNVAGHFIFVGSHAGAHGSAGQIAYATSKGCLRGLVTAYSKEFGSLGMRFHLVLPGFMETSMTKGLSDKTIKDYLDLQSIGEFTTPEASAEFILFLLKTKNVSGQIFKLDSRLNF